MLKHKPLTVDWLAISAHIPIVIFITPQMMTHRFAHEIRLLGPCFKTGQMKHHVNDVPGAPTAKADHGRHSLAMLPS